MASRRRLANEFEKELLGAESSEGRDRPVDYLELNRRYVDGYAPGFEGVADLARSANPGATAARQSLKAFIERDFSGAADALVRGLDSDIVTDGRQLGDVFSFGRHLVRQGGVSSTTQQQLLDATLPYVRDASTSYYAIELIAALEVPQRREALEMAAKSGGWGDPGHAAQRMVDAGLLTESEEAAVIDVAGEFIRERLTEKNVMAAILRELSAWRSSRNDPDGTFARGRQIVNDLSPGVAVREPNGLAPLLADPRAASIFEMVIGHKQPANAELLQLALDLGDKEFLTAVDRGEQLSPEWDGQLDVLRNRLAETDALTALEIPRQWAREQFGELMERHGVLPDSVPGVVLLTTGGTGLMNFLAGTLSHMRDGRAMSVIGDGVDTIHGEKFRWHYRPQRSVARDHDYPDQYRWSNAAQSSLQRVASNFLNKRANSIAVAETLGISTEQLLSPHPPTNRDHRLAEYVGSAVRSSPDVATRFVTFVGRLKGAGLRDAAVLSDEREAGSMAKFLAPVAAGIDVRIKQTAGPSGFEIG